MGCEKCSGGEGGKSCGSNGSCGSGSHTSGGCNSGKFSVFDWLSNMELPNGQEKFDGVEVRFKNGRKEFFRNTEKLSLSIGEVVATEAESGHDIGVISLMGELVKVQMRKKHSDPYEKINRIFRKATQKDIDLWHEVRAKEEDMKIKARKIAGGLNLNMKISDVEYQGDGSKATFYYTADSRVDYRQLIKDFAREFKTRIEMRQIGLRQEAARLGGISTSGRELCCSTWLTDFRSVSTKAARYQQLSLNPEKLAGQCGKLKCCLNFELDSYMDALKDFPKKETKLETKKGKATCQKVDIFKGLLWYAYEEERMNWIVLTTKQAKVIIEAAKAGNPVASLEEFANELENEEEVTEKRLLDEDSITRFDKPKRKKSRKKKKKKREQKNAPDKN